ncbi:transmembrane protein 176B [Thomomys bottae]
MTGNTVTVNGVDLDGTQSHPYQINIHIHQESTLAQLMKAGSSLKQLLSCPRVTGSSKTKTRMSYGQLALGVTQILLGLVSGALGVSFFFGPWTELPASGCAFWAGSAAIMAGSGAIVHQKYRGKLSGFLSLLLTLACIAATLAATVFGVRSLIRQRNSFYSSEIYALCNGRSWRSSYDSDWREEQCRAYMKKMMNIFLAFCILFTVICILKVTVSLASLGLSLRSLCGQNSACQKSNHEDEGESEKKLLGENSEQPSPSKKIPEASIL